MCGSVHKPWTQCMLCTQRANPSVGDVKCFPRDGLWGKTGVGLHSNSPFNILWAGQHVKSHESDEMVMANALAYWWKLVIKS